MDDAGNGDVTVSPHKVRVGELLTITGDDGRHSGWNLAPPGLKAVKDCTVEQTSCVFKAISPTGAWVQYEMNFELGSREQDYYGVLPGKTMIDGRVVDGNGQGIPDVKIKASGPAKLSATTDFDGFYEVDVPGGKSGTYEVKPQTKGFAWSPKSKTVRVKNRERETANFRGNCKGGGDAASGKAFQPVNGLYISGPSHVTSLYYSCATKTFHIRRRVGSLTRPDGARILGRDVALVSKKKKLTSNVFDGLAFRPKTQMWVPDTFVFKPYDVQVEFDGTFTDTSTITMNVEVFATPAGELAGFNNTFSITDAGTQLRLVDRDPSPFDFD
jgi:hypothetical protein